MDQKIKAFIILFTISVIIYVLYLMTSGGENNYLNPSGNRNPANQKLMVVDQDTGEISFIQKSLQGVNAQIVADDSVIMKKLEDHERWIGDRIDEIKELQTHMKTILGNNYSGTASGLTSSLANYTKHNGNDGILGRLRKRVEDIDQMYWDLAGEALYNGNRIRIRAHAGGKNYYLIDDACDNQYGNNDKASWCENKAYNLTYLEKVDGGRRASGG